MIFIEVRCDKCGSVGLSRRCFYAHQMREELKKAGWKHVAEGGKDFCPKCKPRRKPRRRSRTTVVLVNSERKTNNGRMKQRPACQFDNAGCEGLPFRHNGERSCPQCVALYERARKNGMPASGRHG